MSDLKKYAEIEEKIKGITGFLKENSCVEKILVLYEGFPYELHNMGEEEAENYTRLLIDLISRMRREKWVRETPFISIAMNDEIITVFMIDSFTIIYSCNNLEASMGINNAVARFLRDERIRCEKCGRDLTLEVYRCPRCGRSYPFIMDRCPYCGHSSHVKRCPGCGATITSDGRIYHERDVAAIVNGVTSAIVMGVLGAIAVATQLWWIAVLGALEFATMIYIIYVRR